MKFKDLWVIVPVAFLLVACGKSSDSSDAENSAASSNSGLSGGTSVTPPGGTTSTSTDRSSDKSTSTSGPSGSTGSALDASGCPQYPARSFYQYTLSGTGDVSRTTTANQIIADSKLRVSIEPVSVNVSGDVNANKQTSRMAVDVTLLRNGVAVDTITVPVQQNGTTGFTSGVPVGQKSNPSLADFSGSLYGTGKYTIKIGAVRTDTRCNQYCNFQSAQSMCYYYANAYQYCPYVWNWDYHQNQWACCGSDYLQQCQQLQCGVSPILNSYAWSLRVRVETDSTSCITGSFSN